GRLVLAAHEIDLGLHERQAEQRQEQLGAVRVAREKEAVQADGLCGRHEGLLVEDRHGNVPGGETERPALTFHRYASWNGRMDRFEAMRIFVAVADERGFAPAARRLGLSAPAVSRAIVALEQHVGARLLRRTTRNVALTEVGARFHADCTRILAEVAG